MTDTNVSKNAEGAHVHSPETGGHPDDALKPGAHSGSGDVEHAQRVEALLAMDPADLTEEQKDELERAGQPRPGQGRIDGDEKVVAPPQHQPVKVPAGESKQQLKDVQERNKQLLEGAEASHEGERRVGVGQSVSTEPPKTESAPD